MTRTAQLQRSTAETSISVDINIDGTGRYNIKTEIGFFDHMLEQISKHSGIDIAVVTKGDIHIDYHHSVEDTGIVLGKAFAQAMGDCKGIYRYAHSYIPMDETLTRVALDISKRPFLVWKVNFSRDKIGDFDTELFQEFFRAFAFGAGITLHIENLYGENNHHIAESCFKGLAKALKFAVKIDAAQSNTIPSTKNML
jgi:imidazoleglycerol-phosphate dehydratase